MTDKSVPESTPQPTEWDRRWAAYQEFLKKYPADKDNWRIFYAGCEAVASHAPVSPPAQPAKRLMITRGGEIHEECPDCRGECRPFEAVSGGETPQEAPQPTDEEFVNPTRQVMFRAGLLACREYMARFVESESPSIAASIRANWWPSLGNDPGKPRQLRFEEVTDGGDTGPWTCKPIDPSVEALPVALAFILSALRSGSPTQPAEPQWISVEERLPEYDTDVLLWGASWKHVYVGYWRHSEEWIGRYRAEAREEPLPDTNPTHWQPLPAPPVAALRVSPAEKKE